MPLRTSYDFFRLQGDIIWAGFELTAGLFSERFVNLMARKGNGRKPVMTLPGFTGPEFSLAPLNRFLRKNGYIAHSWGMGTNRGPTGIEYFDTMSSILGDRIKRLADDQGEEVALVGQSLGGIYARELARRFPDEVDRVITLGSPAHLNANNPDNINRMVTRAMAYYTGRRVEDHLRDVRESQMNIIEPPPKVPLIAIFSPFDGVAHQDTTSIPEEFLKVDDGIPRENVEIICSHCGMGVNPVVLLAVADRLAQDKTNWQPLNWFDYMPQPAMLASRWLQAARPQRSAG